MPTSVTWIVITPADVDDFLVAAQASAVRTAALGSGQADTFTNVMRAVAGRIQAEIQSCARNKISAVPYAIPPSLRAEACHLIIEALQTRIPALKLTDDQKKNADEARDYLRRIADCKVVVEQPSDVAPDSMQGSNGVELAESSTRLSTRQSLGGLL